MKPITGLLEMPRVTRAGSGSGRPTSHHARFPHQGVHRTQKAFPEFSPSLDPIGEAPIPKKFYRVGPATDPPKGLIARAGKMVDVKGTCALRLMLPLTLAYARCVIAGAVGGRFMSFARTGRPAVLAF